MFFLCLFILFLCSTNCFTDPFFARCKQPVANVWVEPQEDCPTHGLPFMSSDLGRLETQILYGDYVKIIKQNNDWAFVQISCQIHFDSKSQMWGDKCGWVRTSDITKPYKLNWNVFESSPEVLAVIQPWFSIRNEPDDVTSKVIARVPFGTQLEGIPHNNMWFKIGLVDGTVGYVKQTGVLQLNKKYSQQTKRDLLVFLQKCF